MMQKKSSRIAALRYRHSASCCGEDWDWTGPIPKKVQYVCQRCRKEMVPVQREVRTLAACELIDDNHSRFNGEECPACSNKFNHHVVLDDQYDPPAYFLRCGRCNEELREVDKREVTT